MLTSLSMFGGFVLAVFFIGWSDGTYNGIINTFTRNQMGHIQVHEKDYTDRQSMYKTINTLPAIETALEQTPGITSWAPRVYSFGLSSVREKTAAARIIGIDPRKENQTTDFQQKIIEGRMFTHKSRPQPQAEPEPPVSEPAVDDSSVSGEEPMETATEPELEVIVGKGLAKLLKAKLNDEVVILSQGADGSIANDRYKLVGIVDSGNEIDDRMAFYLPLWDAQELLVLEGRLHEIAITINDLNDVEELTAQLKEKLNDPALAVESWMEFARSFYMAMKADKEGMYIMLFIVVLVVAIGVLNTVLMSVLERRKEYGVLRAVGTRPGQIVKMVLLEVNILAVICILAGMAVGLLLNYLGSIHGFTLPEPITYGGMKFERLQTEINARCFYIPMITVFLSATLVSIFPALKAAHTDPAKSMRTH